MPAARNVSLDALRVFSLIGIVTLHVAGGGFKDAKPLAFVLDELSRFAVPAFFILSAYFWKPEELARPLRLTWRVASRVLPAFVFWTAITLVQKELENPNAPAIDYSPTGLLLLAWTGGPAFHLWFLPALVVATALVGFAGRYLGWRWTFILSLLLFVGGTIVGAYAKPIFGHGFPLWVDRNGLFFGPIFLTVGVLLRHHREDLKALPVWGIAAAVLLFGLAQIGEGFFIVRRYPIGHDYSMATLFYAVSVVLLFTRLDMRSPVISTLGKATFVAYLVHIQILGWLTGTVHLISSGPLIIACVTLAMLVGLTWEAGKSAIAAGRTRLAARP